ncbi:MAG: RNA 2',3'-cyclic phosphodiesterase [Candidatus Izemoplasma sp.]|nr:RNA 2',3'-cyclic phosphodiesterase [Candidatus Izemoplasma sp.]
MRIFFAITFDEHIKNQIKNRFDHIKKDIEQANITTPSNYHITLKYIGESNQGEIDKMSEVIQASLKTVNSFDLKLTHFDTFRQRTKNIIYLGVHYNKALYQLYQTLEENLNRLGYQKETRPFTPHVTLAKKARIKRTLPSIASLRFKVTSVSLMLSHRVDGELTYTPLKQFSLKTTKD